VHRDEVKAFRGSVEEHLQLLVRLRGPQVLRDVLDPPVELASIYVNSRRLDYHPFRDRSWWGVVDKLTARLGSLWDAFGCLLPAFIAWLLVAPRFVEISLILAFALGAAMVILAGFVTWRSVGTEETEP
jgi:hypothetical protein